MTTKQILLVEDNPDDVELTIRAFRSSSIPQTLTVATDGAEALVALFGPPSGTPPAELPDLVLLDLKLPIFDGFDVLRRIRANPRTRHVPVVILTSSTQPEDLETGYALGANSYLQKPVSFGDFLTMARQVASYWLTLNRPAHSPTRARVFG
jgi:two-component system response regulator